MYCCSQISFLTDPLVLLIRIDPFSVFPRELSLRALGYLDAMSLCRAAQVSRQWRSLADDNLIWRGICEGHFGQKCLNCGLELPGAPAHLSQRSWLEERNRTSIPPLEATPEVPPPSTDPSPILVEPQAAQRRLWKDFYRQHLSLELNWRHGIYSVRTLKGHTRSVKCLQFSEALDPPSFPVLITGSRDCTARVWNLQTGALVHTLPGHTRGIHALQFDATKLITGSKDHTMRIWDWRTGKCLTLIRGHTAGVVCLNFDSNVLASGSIDRTVKIWNFRIKKGFTLRGHGSRVNAVQLWDSGTTFDRGDGVAVETGSSTLPIDAGKMLFSASGSGTIRMWDLSFRTCVRKLKAHAGQVQSLKLLLADDGGADMVQHRNTSLLPRSPLPPPPPSGTLLSIPTASLEHAEHPPLAKRPKPVLVSGGRDNGVKIWDAETGRVQHTLCGHTGGVQAIAGDQLHLVSGSHDESVIMWSREEGKYMKTLVSHYGPVTSLALGEDKIVLGSNYGDVRVLSFSG